MRGRGQEFRLIATGQPGLSAVSARSDHAFPRHTHDEFGIGLIVAGGQISASGRGQVTAGAGDLITVNPGEVHDGIAVRGEPRAWHMLYLSLERMADLVSGFAAGKPFEFNRPVLAHTSLARSFATAFQRLTAAGAGERHLVSDENLLSLFAPLIAAPDRRTPDRGHAGLRRVRCLLDDEPDANPTLERLANEAGLTRFQLLRAFSAWTGLTPHAYLMQRRAHNARRLILSGSALADAAAEAGYADQSHMTRDFRRRYGLTPADFAGYA